MLFNYENPFYFFIQSIICLCVTILFLSILLDFVYYSRKEKVTQEKKSMVDTGTMTLFFFAIYLIIVNKIGVLNVSNTLLKNTLIILGTIGIITGCCMNIIGRFNLGRNWANHIKIYDEHVLVHEGMYRLVRHPLYASIMLMFYGSVLVYRNILCLILITFIFIPFMYYRAKQEENLLSNTFKEYAEYKKKTGMFFPKIIKRKRN